MTFETYTGRLGSQQPAATHASAAALPFRCCGWGEDAVVAGGAGGFGSNAAIAVGGGGRTLLSAERPS